MDPRIVKESRVPSLPAPPKSGRRDVVLAASIATAYAAFAATFRGPRERFWTRMTATGAVLGTTALLADRSLRRRPAIADLPVGLGIAAGLYAVFRVGDRVARTVMPSGDDDIGDVYELRALRPTPELVARLATVIAPAEELYWRGLVQNAAAERLGPWRGAAVATACYAGAHLATGNPTLIAAAGVAGAGWSALAAAGVSMPALVLSHVVWDIWIFLVQPTQAKDAA
jgi:membrane protease YdiL (CAAX protease family)